MIDKNKNLKPYKKGDTNGKAEAGRLGGLAKAEKNRKLKTFAEAFNLILQQEITNKKGEKATTQEAIVSSMVKKAIEGDVKAAQFIRDTIGQNPTNKQEILSANLTMQKVFVTKDDEEKALKHIEDFIDG